MKLIYFIILALAFTACTIQKRTVNRGYFVQWHVKQKPAQQPVQEKHITSVTGPAQESGAEIPLTDSIQEKNTVFPEESQAARKLQEEHEALNELQQAMQDVNRLERKAVFKPNDFRNLTEGRNSDEKGDNDRDLYIIRAVWNIILAACMLFLIVPLLILLEFTGDPLILFLILAAVHIAVLSIFKTVVFFKMAHILRPENEGNDYERESLRRKTRAGRLGINLGFILLYLILVFTLSN